MSTVRCEESVALLGRVLNFRAAVERTVTGRPVAAPDPRVVVRVVQEAKKGKGQK